MRRTLIFFLLVITLKVSASDVGHIQLPAGFTVNLFARNINYARSLALGPDGVVYVGNRSGDPIYALKDSNGDGRADIRKVILQDLVKPNGITYLNGDLYVAEKHQISRFRDMDQHPFTPGKPEKIADLPDKNHHGLRYLAAGPDEKLYVTIGAPCNICNKPKYARIERMATDGSAREVVAEGVRNSVGMDWDPSTSELWFTDNGRDWMGDDLPPDEINRVGTVGQHFGYPWCHAGNVTDPKYGKEKSCDLFEPPQQRLGAHVAPLGIHFYTGKQFPEHFQQGAFVAEHGSWNRSVPAGYRVMFLRLENGQVKDYQPFMTGWLDESGNVSGRPVDLLTMPDGAMLVSDDKAGVIYRVSYQ